MDAAFHGLVWTFSGVHGMIIEATLVCAATAAITDVAVQGAERSECCGGDDEEEEEFPNECKKGNADSGGSPDITAAEASHLSAASEGKKGLDSYRVCRMSVIGSLYGPAELGYFALLSNLVWWKQVLIDNFIFIPFLNASGIVINKYMRDGSFDGLCAEMGPKLMTMCAAAMPAWMISDTVMFLYVPLRHRVAFSRLVGSVVLAFNIHVLNKEPSAKLTPGMDPATPGPSPMLNAQTSDLSEQMSGLYEDESPPFVPAMRPLVAAPSSNLEDYPHGQQEDQTHG